jgi:hypothetical protein
MACFLSPERRNTSLLPRGTSVLADPRPREHCLAAVVGHASTRVRRVSRHLPRAPTRQRDRLAPHQWSTGEVTAPKPSLPSPLWRSLFNRAAVPPPRSLSTAPGGGRFSGQENSAEEGVLEASQS